MRDDKYFIQIRFGSLCVCGARVWFETIAFMTMVEWETIRTHTHTRSLAHMHNEAHHAIIISYDRESNEPTKRTSIFVRESLTCVCESNHTVRKLTHNHLYVVLSQKFDWNIQFAEKTTQVSLPCLQSTRKKWTVIIFAFYFFLLLTAVDSVEPKSNQVLFSMEIGTSVWFISDKQLSSFYALAK